MRTKANPNPSFSSAAKAYEEKAVVQADAAGRLVRLLSLKGTEDVLDVGCGPGGITCRLKELTSGRVVGIDPEEGMVAEARVKTLHCHNGSTVSYRIETAEEMPYKNEFDVVFCNSAFQWFKDPELAVKNFHRALRPGGRVALQAPATSNYGPSFLRAIEGVKTDPRTRENFLHFRNPWFFLEKAEDYRALFVKAGFAVDYSEIVQESSAMAPEKAFGVFVSGARQGYLSQSGYRVPITCEYRDAFEEIVRDGLEAQKGSDGNVVLSFNRIYLIATKEKD